MLLKSKALLSSNSFYTNLSHFKIQTVKMSFFNARDFKLGHFDVSNMLFSISWILEVAGHNFMKSRASDGSAAKGLFIQSCCLAK